MDKEQIGLLIKLFRSTGEFLGRFNDTRANMRTDEMMAYEVMQNAYLACQNAEVDAALLVVEGEDKEE